MADTPSRPGFLAPFLGAFAAVVLIALVGGGIYFGVTRLHSASSDSKAPKTPLDSSATWQLGAEAAKPLDAATKPDISWWTRTFNLPKEDVALNYLKNQGLTVGRIEPLHYTDTKDATTVTYEVHAEVPTQLLRLQKNTWQPNDPVLARFAPILVLNDGLPPDTFWDTKNATVAAQAGTKLDFAWQVRWDKNYNTVTTDRLPYSDNVYTPEQVTQYENETSGIVSALESQIQQINARVDADLHANLAQIPGDPPKPKPLSSQWGGDGSGEPTKSAERIGGGTVAGAAGGAAFGAAAGNAGLGAGIGAGVGLLGGLIYDSVSKNNDKKRYQREIADQNEERLDEWHSQLKSLANARSQAKQNAAAEREHLLADLAARIQSANGHIDLSNAANNAPPAASEQPTSDQPTGPIRQQ